MVQLLYSIDFNQLKKTTTITKQECTHLNSLWIFSNPNRIKCMYTGSIYTHTNLNLLSVAKGLTKPKQGQGHNKDKTLCN